MSNNYDMEILYQQYRPFLLKLCYRFKRVFHPCEIDDLHQQAYFGLHKAAESYSPEMGSSFIHYLALCVKWAIIREMANSGCTIRIPVHISDKIVNYQRTRKELTQKLMREPYLFEIAQQMEITTKTAEEINKAIRLQSTTSLDTPVGEDGSNTIGDFIPDENAADFCSVERQELCDRLWELVYNQLDGELSNIVRWHVWGKNIPARNSTAKRRFGSSNM
jgi:RNA polymerase sigma factor (sigma-70 family)